MESFPKLPIRFVFPTLTGTILLGLFLTFGQGALAQEATAPPVTPAVESPAEPAAQPTSESAAQPTVEPAAQPAAEPAAQPATEPTPETSETPAPATEPAAAPPATGTTAPELPEAVTTESGTDEFATPDVEAEPASEDAATADVATADASGAEEIGPPIPWWESGYATLLALFLVFAGSIYFASALSKAWRMPEHNMRLFILFLCFFGAVVATALGWHRLTLGIDLRGGVILVYDVSTKVVEPSEQEKQAGQTPAAGQPGTAEYSMDQLTKALGMRINPGGVREISITKLGKNQVKIIIPAAEDAEVARIERVISESGALEFRILASEQYDSDRAIIDRARNEHGSTVFDIVDGKQVRRAFWVPVAPTERDSFMSGQAISRVRGKELEVLVLVDRYNVLGKDIKNIRETVDERQQPALGFSFHPNGAKRFYALTNENKADPVQPNRLRQLGIIMNGELYSAPTLRSAISDSGIIEFSSRNTQAEKLALQKEIDHLMNVMNAGSLPADLSKEPVSRMLTGATLGEDTINKGKNAFIVGITLIFLFMLGYYRLAGVIACFAVIMNFFLIMAVMLALRAAFTLPGLAGLVLTLAMSVDANILIFERIREELAAGASLRIAIRNGFDRALSAIVDSNLTTIISGIILYAVGSEQIKGFAVTLVLGVTFSMFTATYCCRTIFEVLERHKWITTLRMMRLFTKTNINFMGVRNVFFVFSGIVIVISLVATGMRGKGILDIDFVGGVSVEAIFRSPQTIDEVRSKLGDRDKGNLPDLSVSNIRLDAVAAERMEKETGVKPGINTHYIINTSVKPEFYETPDNYLREVVGVLEKEFGDTLIYNTLNYEIKSTTETAPANGEKPADPDAPAQAITTVALLTIEPVTNRLGLESKLDELAKKAQLAAVTKDTFSLDLVADDTTPTRTDSGGGIRSKTWLLTMNTSGAEAEAFLNYAKEYYRSPYLPSSNTIGGAVARYAQIQAILALGGCLVCIVGYIWFRFQKVIYGIAAVLSLVHDVIVTLGCIALSYWFAPYLGFLGVEEFKIGLPVVAAFLTLIGYSLNDTIIVFDRIREVKGKLPDLNIDIINTSINQTLSRTLLTSISTAVVLGILYFFGGAGIHTFSFAMLVGIVFGTYSSVYIASALLLWLSEPRGTQAKDKKDKYSTAKK